MTCVRELTDQRAANKTGSTGDENHAQDYSRGDMQLLKRLVREVANRMGWSTGFSAETRLLQGLREEHGEKSLEISS